MRGTFLVHPRLKRDKLVHAIADRNRTRVPHTRFGVRVEKANIRSDERADLLDLVASEAKRKRRSFLA